MRAPAISATRIEEELKNRGDPKEEVVEAAGDRGDPVTVRPSDARAQPFVELARRVEQRCAETQSAAPSITIED